MAEKKKMPANKDTKSCDNCKKQGCNKNNKVMGTKPNSIDACWQSQ